jgi:hypothetical protein
MNTGAASPVKRQSAAGMLVLTSAKPQGARLPFAAPHKQADVRL